MVSSAIPVLSDAVSSIVTNSAHELFQQMCLEVLDATSLAEVGGAINNGLRSLANKKLGLNTGRTLPEDFKCSDVSRQQTCFLSICNVHSVF